MSTDTEVKDKPFVSVIQFQMATDAVTGGSFQATSDVVGELTSAKLAAKLATMREGGMIEMAASNRRRLEHARIIERTLEEKVKERRAAGKHISNKDIDEARMQTNMELSKLEAICVADDAMLLENAPILGEVGN